jgi:hypothetical protein
VKLQGQASAQKPVEIDCEALALTQFQALNPEPPDCVATIPETLPKISLWGMFF